ncbi:hypothetical protein A2U01_0086071, partial [Trifolium medium]|nr:hypothetical protein [Trifolium medium]
ISATAFRSFGGGGARRKIISYGVGGAKGGGCAFEGVSDVE